jgi:hypothetical protein
MVMQQNAASSFLKALPPSLTAAAVVNWGLYTLTNHAPLEDAEQGNGGSIEIDDHTPGVEPGALRMSARSRGQQTGIVNDAGQPRRRNSLRPHGGSAETNGSASGSDTLGVRMDTTSQHQQAGIVDNAGRSARRNPPNLQDRLEDPEFFVVGDDSDDAASHRN